MKFGHYIRYFSEDFSLHEADPSLINETDKEISSGKLTRKTDKIEFPIINGIPRFLNQNHLNYSDNFGLQWNKYKKTQFDSYTKLPLSSDRFWHNTKWTKEELNGKKVLEVGSGAGRFTEILIKSGASVISFDLSNAVEANYENNHNHGDLLIFQGDIYDIPFPDEYFDFIFCFGVLQHTPKPNLAYVQIFKKLKRGGKISIDYYLKFPSISPWSTPKYLWRPITKNLPPSILLRWIKFYIPFWIPIDTFLRRLPHFGNKIVALIPIPCWNYLDIGLSQSQRVQWAILDTFDALAPRYDYPKTIEEVAEMISSEKNRVVDIFYGSNGVVANIIKK